MAPKAPGTTAKKNWLAGESPTPHELKERLIQHVDAKGYFRHFGKTWRIAGYEKLPPKSIFWFMADPEDVKVTEPGDQWVGLVRPDGKLTGQRFRVYAVDRLRYQPPSKSVLEAESAHIKAVEKLLEDQMAAANGGTPAKPKTAKSTSAPQSAPSISKKSETTKNATHPKAPPKVTTAKSASKAEPTPADPTRPPEPHSLPVTEKTTEVPTMTVTKPDQPSASAVAGEESKFSPVSKEAPANIGAESAHPSTTATAEEAPKIDQMSEPSHSPALEGTPKLAQVSAGTPAKTETDPQTKGEPASAVQMNTAKKRASGRKRTAVETDFLPLPSDEPPAPPNPQLAAPPTRRQVRSAASAPLGIDWTPADVRLFESSTYGMLEFTLSCKEDSAEAAVSRVRQYLTAVGFICEPATPVSELFGFRVQAAEINEQAANGWPQKVRVQWWFPVPDDMGEAQVVVSQVSANFKRSQILQEIRAEPAFKLGTLTITMRKLRPSRPHVTPRDETASVASVSAETPAETTASVPNAVAPVAEGTPMAADESPADPPKWEPVPIDDSGHFSWDGKLFKLTMPLMRRENYHYFPYRYLNTEGSRLELLEYTADGKPTGGILRAVQMQQPFRSDRGDSPHPEVLVPVTAKEAFRLEADFTFLWDGMLYRVIPFNYHPHALRRDFWYRPVGFIDQQQRRLLLEVHNQAKQPTEMWVLAEKMWNDSPPLKEQLRTWWLDTASMIQKKDPTQPASPRKPLWNSPFASLRELWQEVRNGARALQHAATLGAPFAKGLKAKERDALAQRLREYGIVTVWELADPVQRTYNLKVVDPQTRWAAEYLAADPHRLLLRVNPRGLRPHVKEQQLRFLRSRGFKALALPIEEGRDKGYWALYCRAEDWKAIRQVLRIEQGSSF